MRSVLMVCHGNICRSPMAATLMRVMAEAAGWDDALWVDSCGVSDEEEGNPMDRRAVALLLSHGIRPAPHEARRFSRGDYAMYDDILCMEERNRRGLLRLLGGDPEGKLRLLLDYTDDPHDIEDPWYSGDFEKAYREIREGCTRDEKSRTFSSNPKRSHILRTSSRSRRLILSSIVSFAVWLKCTRTI